jgi:hypothetical protein
MPSTACQGKRALALVGGAAAGGRAGLQGGLGGGTSGACIRYQTGGQCNRSSRLGATQACHMHLC